jgi:hypothetical protein
MRCETANCAYCERSSQSQGTKYPELPFADSIRQVVVNGAPVPAYSTEPGVATRPSSPYTPESNMQFEDFETQLAILLRSAGPATVAELTDTTIAYWNGERVVYATLIRGNQQADRAVRARRAPVAGVEALARRLDDRSCSERAPRPAPRTLSFRGGWIPYDLSAIGPRDVCQSAVDKPARCIPALGSALLADRCSCCEAG